jgi:hypothetical protein
MKDRNDVQKYGERGEKRVIVVQQVPDVDQRGHKPDSQPGKPVPPQGGSGTAPPQGGDTSKSK